MAELTFKSPGVSTREIDVSAPSGITPSGTPAAVVGTSVRGPAFVPVTLATFQDFVATYGPTDGTKFGPLAMREWLRNAGSGIYLKILGIGDGSQRSVDGANAGRVQYAGFVVGNQLPQAGGIVAANPYATSGGAPGRTFLLGAYMSESAGSTYFSRAGLQTSSAAVPIIRGVIMAPSGVAVTLQSGSVGVTTAQVESTTIYGTTTGSVDTTASGRDQFILLLNGHKNTSQYPNIVTASFDPTSPNYFGQILNTDPLKLEEAGHYLYTKHDVYDGIAVVTGSGITPTNHIATQEPAAFVVVGSAGHNAGSTTQPNYEGFEDRFRTAFSPWFISQTFGGQPKNIFRVHALDDGSYPNARLKLSIENLTTSRDARSPYGTFDLVVRRFDDTDSNPVILERFSRLSLDPDSDRYISRVIGDRHTYFDFDKRISSQRLVTDGDYPNKSSLIRVEMDPEVSNKTIDATALPVGFRGPYHLVTSGTNLVAGANGTSGITSAIDIIRANQPPIAFRDTITLGVDLKKQASNLFYWGVQFEVKDNPTQPNRTQTHDQSINGFTKFFPYYHSVYLNPFVGDNPGAAMVNGAILDSDLYNNNIFSLERIAVVTGTDGVADPTQWVSASYVRDGSSAGSAPYRFLNVSTDVASLANRPFLKFSTFMQGGFDGVNLFNSAKTNLTDTAISWEIADPSSQGGVSGPTVSAYQKAITILSAKANADIQLLAIPGIRQPAVTDFAIQEIEDRFDALYLMDVQQYDAVNSQITGSGDPSITYTAQNFVARNMDTSFAAAYFPDVVMTDPTTNTNLVVPPTVAVLGAFSLNDAVGFPWFAPAGFTRGALQTTLEASVKLNRANLDTLYDADINPIVAFPGQPTVVFGQKTLQQAQSALDRVNVRRLLIDLRRQVRQIANGFLFEPNRAETLARFQAAVQPVLATVQAQRGVERYKVVIDTTTTTQVDVENNTIRGKIFVQPTRSLEFVSLDFVVSNSI